MTSSNAEVAAWYERKAAVLEHLADGKHTACSYPPGGATTGTRCSFVRHVQANKTTVVTAHENFPAYGHKASNDPSISADGRYVAFDTLNPNITPAGAGVYVRDLTSTDLTFVSRASGSSGETWPGDDPSLSADGAMVAFGATPTGYAYANVFAMEWGAGVPAPITGSDLSLTLTVSNKPP